MEKFESILSTFIIHVQEKSSMVQKMQSRPNLVFSKSKPIANALCPMFRKKIRALNTHVIRYLDEILVQSLWELNAESVG